MHAPCSRQDSVQLILKHVSELGWDGCAFSDDAFSNKKIMPGYVFRSISDKKWTDRCRVTAASMQLMLRHAIEAS